MTEGAAIPEPKKSEDGKLDTKPWLARISASEKRRNKFLDGPWRANVKMRVQRPFSSSGDASAEPDRLALPEDWARTKQKAAQLNYQIPKIVATTRQKAFEGKTAVVTADVNDVLKRECRAAYMMDECLADVINASGIMVSKIGYEKVTETIMVDTPEIAEPQVDPLGNLIPSVAPPKIVQKPVEKTVSQRLYWDHVSPADFLWPAEFRSSDWDKAPWLGIQTWMTVEQAKKLFKLPDDFKSTSKKPKGLNDDYDDLYSDPELYVRVTEIWYKAWLFDADKAHPDCIRRIVFVEGKDEPVEFDQTDWQEWIPEVPPGPPGLDGKPTTPGKPGYYKGLKKLPIRVETLTYVSDTAIPPSDTEAGRAQVKELLRSRAQMLRQRDHSIPVRWYNVNLVDEEVAEQLKRGVYEDFVPVNGDGTRMIGEVARASYPRENFEFQRVIGGDLDRAWSLSNNQLATPNSGARSATEVNVVQNAGQVRLDYEKWRVNRYLVDGAEVLFSLMQMFRDGTKYVPVPGPNGDELQPVEPADLMGDYVFEFVADSSDRVDVVTKQNNSMKMYNLMANSDTTNKKGLEREIWELHGFDPAEMMVEPQPKGPPPPNISYRFSGEDLLNPMAVALMVKAGYELKPDEIKAAAMLIQDAVKQIKTLHVLPGGTPPGAPPAAPGAFPGQQPVEPPETVEPILKRAVDGTHLT